jgi:YesN/AraC family two-component response regulator
MSNFLQEIQVLYVEDEKETREELHEFLKRRVGKIYPAKNGLEGLELYQQYKPDIIIADLFMPEIGGIEMVRKIKSDGSNPDVIITSAINDVNVILSAVDVGIDKYIVKPINIQELIQELSRLAEKKISRSTDKFAYIIENKKQLEDAIKKDFASFLKTFTGKGPKDVKVFVHNGVVELTAYEVLTPLEKSILDKSLNIAIIEQYRRLFFSVQEAALCKIIFNNLLREVRLTEVSVDTEKDINRIVFSILC